MPSGSPIAIARYVELFGIDFQRSHREQGGAGKCFVDLCNIKLFGGECFGLAQGPLGLKLMEVVDSWVFR